MNKYRKHITVFEHESIRFDKGEKRITEDQFKALQLYYGDGVPYYKLSYNGVIFNEYVGVIQVGNTLIEVLPKSDKISHAEKEENKWRDLLFGMLRAVGSFELKLTSNSNLKIKPNTILDLYIQMFIKEVEYLIHNGLAKKYRKKEGNVLALKGNWQFGKHLQQNLIHQERFYVRYTTYDFKHKLHLILYKTIRLLKKINTNATLQSRIDALLLQFPEMPDIKVNEATFDTLVYNRKTQAYKKALDIAKLLLLQYHPDLSKGRNHVLALMFDMNKLWEQFIYISLKKHKTSETTIVPKSYKYFWKPTKGNRSRMVPDIVINKDSKNCIVLDTKWKNLTGYNPSPDDLRQMYVYHEYYGAKKVALIYPGDNGNIITGKFISTDGENILNKECSLIPISVQKMIKEWQFSIFKEIDNWIQTP